MYFLSFYSCPLILVFVCFLSSTQIAEYSYRAAVRELVPQLCYLDDVKVEEDKLSCRSTFDDHWDMLQACTISHADLEDGAYVVLN